MRKAALNNKITYFILSNIPYLEQNKLT